jgi:regulatory protein
MLAKNRLTKEQALEKIKHYCGYQERCHQEVKEKLFGYGLHKKEVEEILSNIIENNYLNEERFATHFAGGKFRIKQWGKRKIQYELQQKGIGSYLIKLALKEISDEDYLVTLKKLAQKKWLSLKGEQHMLRHSKTNAYLVQKGFEPSLVSKVINEIKTAG